MTNSFSKIVSHPTYTPNSATRIMAEVSTYHYSDMSGVGPCYLDPEGIQDYWFRMAEDYCECYDEEWYGIMMVKAAQASIDWEYVRDSVCDVCPQWLRSKLTLTDQSC